MSEFEVADGAFNYLSRFLTPLVVHAVPSSERPAALKGFARVGDQRVRVIIWASGALKDDTALEFDLIRDDASLRIEALVDFLQGISGAVADLVLPDGLRDGRGNRVVRAIDIGFRDDGMSRRVDLNIFSLISVLENGGGFPWFENVLIFRGFMLLDSGKFRIYFGIPDKGVTVGLDVPLFESTGRPRGYSGLPNEIVSLADSGQVLKVLPAVLSDDYCDKAFDLSQWLGGS